MYFQLFFFLLIIESVTSQTHFILHTVSGFFVSKKPLSIINHHRMLFPEKRHLEVRIKIKMVIHIQYLERNVLFFHFTWTG